ncbi:hypothetical protein [Actinocorallia libanotica]|uniref:Uncharacterized protein n=1 Tax=Actinocorallia libanotica TaxID=46162 RepID=A0ABN1RFA9_9ACTN
MRSLFSRILALGATGGRGKRVKERITFNECCGGRACDSACRSASHRDRVKADVLRLRL